MNKMEKLVCTKDFEIAATATWDDNAGGYYSSGADDEITLQENINAYRRILLLPRMLRTDVTYRILSTTFLGEKVKFPFGIAPTAMQCMCHPEGECATAEAASNLGTVYIQSTLSTKSIEEVKNAAPNGVKWFQLYIYKDRQVTQNLVNRAVKAGFKAIVLTVDAPLFGKRREDERNKFKLPPNMSLANFEDAARSSRAKHSDGGSGIYEYVSSMFDQSITWKDLDWLKNISSLPIIVKGILRPDDAIEAARRGVSGVIVSNHGARQLDTTPATIDVLPSVVEALKGSGVEVFVDCGIRTGADVFKALALGARGAFVGRPVLHGLTVAGRQGVSRVMEILRDELSGTMALMGIASVMDIAPDSVSSSLSSKAKL